MCGEGRRSVRVCAGVHIYASMWKEEHYYYVHTVITLFTMVTSNGLNFRYDYVGPI